MHVINALLIIIDKRNVIYIYIYIYIIFIQCTLFIYYYINYTFRIAYVIYKLNIYRIIILITTIKKHLALYKYKII